MICGCIFITFRVREKASQPGGDRLGPTFYTALRAHFCDVAIAFPVNVLN